MQNSASPTVRRARGRGWGAGLTADLPAHRFEARLALKTLRHILALVALLSVSSVWAMPVLQGAVPVPRGCREHEQAPAAPRPAGHHCCVAAAGPAAVQTRVCSPETSLHPSHAALIVRAEQPRAAGGLPDRIIRPHPSLRPSPLRI